MTQSAQRLDRRGFLGATTWIVGGAVIAGLVPQSLLAAAPGVCDVDASMYADSCGDWQVDDICMAYPPYALAMGVAPQVSGATTEFVFGVDRHWLA
jgi:hypothetical protein